MNKSELVRYLERIDRDLHSPATLFIYGSAACILLDEPDRTSLDVDVAGPYSQADEADLRQVAENAGLPVNPDEDYSGDHIEWVGPLRLCLRPPSAECSLTLWHGARLRVQTVPIPDLVASKLIRYDEIDQTDIQYLLTQSPSAFEEIETAVSRLPQQFADDALVRENLASLRTDMEMWGVARHDRS